MDTDCYSQPGSFPLLPRLFCDLNEINLNSRQRQYASYSSKKYFLLGVLEGLRNANQELAVPSRVSPQVREGLPCNDFQSSKSLRCSVWTSVCRLETATAVAKCSV